MFIEMIIAGITMDPVSNTPIIILKDLEGKQALPIWIGVLEASSIATILGNIKPPRPMTHDLLKNILDNLQVTVDRIEVTDIKENTFYATIHLLVDNEKIAIDARPSDAIALALREHSPIFVDEKVIENSRSVVSDKPEGEEKGSKDKEAEKWKEILENLSPEDFGKYKM
ncbi:MAG: bifunctional nuclease family protein [Deltaproteobacteria bacterium]|nr:bifunctional nuclease family protein [Deltaproteobacteria bacterium]